MFFRDCGFLNSILLPCCCFYFFSPCCLFAGSIQLEILAPSFSALQGRLPSTGPRRRLPWAGEQEKEQECGCGWDHSACQPGSHSSPPLNLHNCAMTMPSRVVGEDPSQQGVSGIAHLLFSLPTAGKVRQKAGSEAAHSASPSWPPLLPVSRPRRLTQSRVAVW